MGLDFSQLYSLLELEPGCSLEEFKHAYRKRVAALHPDRRASRSAGDDDEGTQFATLNLLYRMAIQFHHMHGRLPGSAAREPLAPDARKASLCTSTQPHSATSEQQSPRVPASHWWLLAALACLVAYLVFSHPPGEGPQQARPKAATTR